MDKEAILRGYLAAALWTSTTIDGDPMDENYTTSDFSADALRDAEINITAFLDLAEGYLEGIDSEQIGHDFWLTRNHEGTGFWDRGLEHGDKLTDICEDDFTECYIYLDGSELGFDGI